MKYVQWNMSDIVPTCSNNGVRILRIRKGRYKQSSTVSTFCTNRKILQTIENNYDTIMHVSIAI